jgi:hypothetical protein
MTPARRDPQNQASDAIEKSADKEEAFFSKVGALIGDRGKEDNGKHLNVKKSRDTVYKRRSSQTPLLAVFAIIVLLY